MAAGAGIDLHRLAAGRADALRIVGRGLIAFDDADAHLPFEIVQRTFEQRGLARAGRAHQIQCQDPTLGEPAAIALGQHLVLGKNLTFECDCRTVRTGVQRALIGLGVVRMRCREAMRKTLLFAITVIAPRL
jgi:hypothetical protein